MDAEHLQFHVLCQIDGGQNRHGYGIAQSLNGRLGTDFKAKQMYPILAELLRKEWTTVSHSTESMAGAGKFEHTITEAGRARRVEIEASLARQVEQIQNSMNFIRRTDDDDRTQQASI